MHVAFQSMVGTLEGKAEAVRSAISSVPLVTDVWTIDKLLSENENSPTEGPRERAV